MTVTAIEINAICNEIGTPPPKVAEYANCIAVSFRNGDGLKTLVTFDADAKPETIRHKIATAFKIKAGNAASDDKIAEVLADPVTPAAEIRKYQQSKKRKEPPPPWDEETSS